MCLGHKNRANIFLDCSYFNFLYQRKPFLEYHVSAFLTKDRLIWGG